MPPVEDKKSKRSAGDFTTINVGGRQYVIAPDSQQPGLSRVSRKAVASSRR